MIETLVNLLPGLSLLLPLGLVVAELVAVDDEPRAGLGRLLVFAYALTTSLLALTSVLAPSGAGSTSLAWQWAPSLGFEISFYLSPSWAALLALTSLAWGAALRDASRRVAFASSLAQFGLGLCVASADALSSLAGVAVLGIAGVSWASASGPVGRRSAPEVGRRFAAELVVALAAGLVLCFAVGLATHAASHEVWRFMWSDVAAYVFPAAVQEQNLLLLLLFVAPLSGVFPFGGGFLAVASSMSAVQSRHWLIVGPLAAAALWSSALRVLAPRISAQWAFPLILLLVGSAVLRVLIARGRRSRSAALAPAEGSDADRRGVFALTPLLLVGACLGTATAWGSHAIWLAAAAHVLGVVGSGRESAFGRYLRAGSPGGVLFAAWMATWMAMSQSVATLTNSEALISGTALAVPLLLRWRLLLGSDADDSPREGVGDLRASLALGLSLSLGLFPGAVVQTLSPHEATRAAELTLTRCGDLELADLHRPRLRSELRLGCADPAVELETAFSEATRQGAAEDPPVEGEAGR
jgi:hypothetical protein